MLTYNGQVCHSLIPSGHTNEESQDPSLHRVFASSHMFRGRDGIGIPTMLRERLQTHYEALLDDNGNKDYTIPNDVYTAISDAIDYAGDATTVELRSPELLYLFEFYIITKIGGTTSPYVNIEWPGIQIPMAITSRLQVKGLNFPFINDNNDWEQHDVYFYERNPAGCGLDFTDTKDIKTDFLRYAIEYHCQNPISDIKKHPLPLLEELVDGVSFQLMVGPQGGREPRQDLDRALKEADSTRQWFPSNRGPCQQDLNGNRRLGAGGAMTLGRIQDPKGAKTLVVSYKTAARAAAAISRQLFKIVGFADPNLDKLTIDTNPIMGGKQDPYKQIRGMILVSMTSMHSESHLNSAPCGPKADPKTIHTWLIGTLPRLDHYPPTSSPPLGFTEDIEMEADLQGYTDQRQEQATSTSQQ